MGAHLALWVGLYVFWMEGSGHLPAHLGLNYLKHWTGFVMGSLSWLDILPLPGRLGGHSEHGLIIKSNIWDQMLTIHMEGWIILRDFTVIKQKERWVSRVSAYQIWYFLFQRVCKNLSISESRSTVNKRLMYIKTSLMLIAAYNLR